MGDKIIFVRLSALRLFYVGRVRAVFNHCRKTKPKAITPTNHNRSRQRDEPIAIPSNYL